MKNLRTIPEFIKQLKLELSCIDDVYDTGRALELIDKLSTRIAPLSATSTVLTDYSAVKLEKLNKELRAGTKVVMVKPYFAFNKVVVYDQKGNYEEFSAQELSKGQDLLFERPLSPPQFVRYVKEPSEVSIQYIYLMRDYLNEQFMTQPQLRAHLSNGEEIEYQLTLDDLNYIQM